MAGFKHDGAFAQYMLADPDTTVHLPSKVSYEQGAPLMCAGVSTQISWLVLFPDRIQGNRLGCLTQIEFGGASW
jgi:NADPH:quinone reductase-like Zn-dependent oxidoreductase